MKEYNTQGELVSHKRKLIQRIADKKELVFIEQENLIILSGRKEGINPWSGLCKVVVTFLDNWDEAFDLAHFYDKHYSAKDKKEKNKIIVDSTKLTLKSHR